MRKTRFLSHRLITLVVCCLGTQMIAQSANTVMTYVPEVKMNRFRIKQEVYLRHNGEKKMVKNLDTPLYIQMQPQDHARLFVEFSVKGLDKKGVQEYTMEVRPNATPGLKLVTKTPIFYPKTRSMIFDVAPTAMEHIAQLEYETVIKKGDSIIQQREIVKLYLKYKITVDSGYVLHAEVPANSSPVVDTARNSLWNQLGNSIPESLVASPPRPTLTLVPLSRSSILPIDTVHFHIASPEITPILVEAIEQALQVDLAKFEIDQIKSFVRFLTKDGIPPFTLIGDGGKAHIIDIDEDKVKGYWITIGSLPNGYHRGLQLVDGNGKKIRIPPFPINRSLTPEVADPKNTGLIWLLLLLLIPLLYAVLRQLRTPKASTLPPDFEGIAPEYEYRTRF